jgi:putative hydrolase of the HAD superfamily
VKKYRAVIFDLDDTLYPERDYVCSGFNAVCEWAAKTLRIPAKQGFDELVELFDCGNRSETFGLWLNRMNIQAPEIIPKLVQIYREHTPVIRPFEGVPELLSALSSRFQLALLSDGSVERQEKKVTALGLEKYFQAMVFSDAWGMESWKPNPWIYGVILKQLGRQGLESIYVGDNPRKDFRGAKLADLYTIRLRLPGGLYANEEPPDQSYAPDVEIFSHGQLAELLLNDTPVIRS